MQDLLILLATGISLAAPILVTITIGWALLKLHRRFYVPKKKTINKRQSPTWGPMARRYDKIASHYEPSGQTGRRRVGANLREFK